MQVGFWKPELSRDRHGGVDAMSRIPASKRVVSSPLDKRRLIGTQPLESLQCPPSLVTDQESMLSLEQHVSQSDRKSSVSIDSWRSAGRGVATGKNIFVQLSFSLLESQTVDINGAQHENGLFSSSLSEVFYTNWTLSTNSVVFRQSVDVSTPYYDEPFQSLEDMEAQTFRDLLPDDDDLLSGVFDELGFISQPSNGDDIEEFDHFSSGGGMELEGDAGSDKFIDVVGSSINSQQSVVNGSNTGEHASTTIFLRNILGNVEGSELKLLVEQYGDIRTFYTACKCCRFVMISYIRAARNAMRALQNKPLRHRKPDFNFSILKVNGDDLAELKGREVANTNVISCISLDFVLQLHFVINQDVLDFRNSG